MFSLRHTAHALSIALLPLLASAPLLSQAASPTATLKIQTDKNVAKVSPTLYGLMTEEINYSYDGGLYAEMIRNRTFRGNWSGVLYWYLVENGNGQGRMEVDPQTGPSAALNQSLRLEVAKADPQNQVGVLNQGYWGMGL